MAQNRFSRFMAQVWRVIRFLLPWGITAWLVIWTLRKVSIAQMRGILSEGCNWWCLGVMMLMTGLAMGIRGFRWEMQLRQAGASPAPPATGPMAIFGAYALNLVFPRLGEAWRCLWVSKRQNTPFMTSLGTDFGDRGTDLVCVLIMLAMAFALCPQEMWMFMHKYPFGRGVGHFFASPWTWTVVVVIVAGMWAMLHFGRGNRRVESVRTGLLRMWHGFASLLQVRPVSRFLWLTLGIWVAYFFQVYVCFFAFPFSEFLLSEPGTLYGTLPGLLCLVFGTCSTLIPSNGGLGPWTIAIAYALQLYGMPMSHATAFALVVWVLQSLTIVFLGIIAAFYAHFSSKGAHNIHAPAQGQA